MEGTKAWYDVLRKERKMSLEMSVEMSVEMIGAKGLEKIEEMSLEMIEEMIEEEEYLTVQEEVTGVKVRVPYVRDMVAWDYLSNVIRPSVGLKMDEAGVSVSGRVWYGEHKDEFALYSPTGCTSGVTDHHKEEGVDDDVLMLSCFGRDVDKWLEVGEDGKVMKNFVFDRVNRLSKIGDVIPNHGVVHFMREWPNVGEVDQMYGNGSFADVRGECQVLL